MTKLEKVLRVVDWIVSVAILLIGIAHNALTPKLFPELGPKSFLFVGTGLAFMFLGIINFAGKLKGSGTFITLLSSFDIYNHLYAKTKENSPGRICIPYTQSSKWTFTNIPKG